jgi:hypothetical protein
VLPLLSRRRPRPCPVHECGINYKRLRRDFGPGARRGIYSPGRVRRARAARAAHHTGPGAAAGQPSRP